MESHEHHSIPGHYGKLPQKPFPRPNFVNLVNSCVNPSPFYSHQPGEQDDITLSNEI
jgi:hypothetical protein